MKDKVVITFSQDEIRILNKIVQDADGKRATGILDDGRDGCRPFSLPDSVQVWIRKGATGPGIRCIRGCARNAVQ
jgi:hypothetical protein